MMGRLVPLEGEKALGGAPKKSELRRDRGPWSHLEKEGPSVALLQGLLQLLHVALQLQVLIPGVLHLLLPKETLPILSRAPPQKPQTHPHSGPQLAQLGEREGEPRRSPWAGLVERDLGCLLMHTLTPALGTVLSYLYCWGRYGSQPWQQGTGPHQMNK